MKQNMIVRLLGVETLICLITALLQWMVPGVHTSFLAFPYGPISQGLRWLSLNSPFGNLLALAIYLAISLVPLVLLIWFKTHRPLVWEDLLLPLLSIMLLRFLYLMINPGEMRTGFHLNYPDFLGLLLHSVTAAYLILRAVRKFRQGEPSQLGAWMQGILVLAMAYLIFISFGPFLQTTLSAATSIREGNTIQETELLPTYLMLALGYIIRILPNLLLIWVSFLSLDLFRAMAADAYSTEVVEIAHRLSQASQQVLVVIVSSSLGYNLLQYFFADTLRQIDLNLLIPFDLVIFSLAALLFARFIRETRQLKTEHDLFI